jgi:acyl dehydratase
VWLKGGGSEYQKSKIMYRLGLSVSSLFGGALRAEAQMPSPVQGALGGNGGEDGAKTTGPVVPHQPIKASVSISSPSAKIK